MNKEINSGTYSVLFKQKGFDYLSDHLSDINYSKIFIHVDNNTKKNCLDLFLKDNETKSIVMIGEIGGQLEADAAKWIKANGTKPVVGFIAGQTAPAGRTMGHAGAIVGGAEDTAEAKMAIMRECGITVAESPAEIGKMMAELMGVRA